MTKDEALKMAIEALDLANGARIIEGIVLDNYYEINACKEALEQPAQEPVSKVESKCKCDFRTKLVGDGCRYCQPQDFIDRLLDDLKDSDERIDELEIKEWQGLTDAENEAIIQSIWEWGNDFPYDEYRICIEQALKEKNT